MRSKRLQLFCACAALAACAAGLGTRPPALKPFEREQTRGNIRVVLLKVERATVFASEGVRNAEKGKAYPIPMLGVTYLVEAFGDEPIRSWSLNSGDDFAMAGKRLVDDARAPENLVAGGHSSTRTISQMANEPIAIPTITDKHRTCVIKR